MDLFDYMRETSRETESPLAARLRPTKLEEVVGQQHIIGRDKLLYRAIKADKISSLIFYGPPGTGKTTLAKVIAGTTRSQFQQINATVAGKKDMEQVVKEAQDRQGMYGQKTILFIDEIHRFNKSQQDYLLPYVENGTVTLIGATTENPYFEVNGALLSRSMIFELKPLETADILELIRRAVYDTDRGMGAYDAVIDEDAAEFLAEMAGGDARRALNAVELGVMTTPRSADGKIHLTMDVVRECIQKRTARYDKKGDNHYDTISAFIKSMRGSDPDAAVYYLARMIEAGEDPVFIARRIMICAAEDVGNADPNAIVVAVNCSLACERIGMPESQIILAQAAEYVATAPKSNTAVESIAAARNTVQQTGSLPIPGYLQDAHYKGAPELGRGLGYQYAHLYEDHYAGQPLLPEQLRGTKFYQPSENGYEKKIREHMASLTGDDKYIRPEQLLKREQ
ncbi:MAG: replication-associated recombination protein A [Lachnospiraceae bacterium]